MIASDVDIPTHRFAFSHLGLSPFDTDFWLISGTHQLAKDTGSAARDREDDRNTASGD